MLFVLGYLKAARDIFFPRLCLYCANKISTDYLCCQCLDKITFASPAVCQDSRDKARSYEKIISVTNYREPLIRLIHLFKYRNYDYLAKFFFQLMIKRLAKIGFNSAGYDLITAVPMHPLKLKARGYNQAELLAKLLANYFNIPFKNDIIKAVTLRPSQTKFLKSKRQDNVAGIFTASREAENKNIMIIDDIFTTGATLSACAVSLKQKGAKAISAITLSRA